MRSLWPIPMLALGTAWAASPATASPMQSVPCDDVVPMHSWDQPATTGGDVDIGQRVPLRKKLAMMALREEGRRLQDADGGRLTESDRDYLQAKLDAIQSGNY